MIRRAFDDDDLDPELADAFGYELEDDSAAEAAELAAALEAAGLIGPREEDGDES